MKGRIIKILGEIVGKEISEEVQNEFQDEIDEFKELIKANKGLEDVPNLELESFELKVTSAGQKISKDFKTKIEHKKVLGVFTLFRNGDDNAGTNYDSKLSIQVDRNYIVADGMFHFVLIEKTNNYSVYEAAWRTDVKIDASDVHIEYADGNSVTVPYKVNVFFICEKSDKYTKK